MLNFVPALPCVGHVEVTCLKKPFIDLSCKLGSLQMHSLGIADFNVNELINGIVRDMITAKMLFPKKMR